MIRNKDLTTPIGQHGKHIKPENLRFSWSKWGDINYGYLERTPEWICQVCSESQPPAIDAFLFPISDREYIRICAKCQHMKVLNKVTELSVLIKLRRKIDEQMGR